MTSTDDHPPPFVCGMGLLGISVPLTLTAAQTACVRASSLRTLSEFTIRAVSSNLPSWSDSRPSKFLRRRLKVIKKMKGREFFFLARASLFSSWFSSSLILLSSIFPPLWRTCHHFRRSIGRYFSSAAPYWFCLRNQSYIGHQVTQQYWNCL